jgi:general L-amino acid transport system permease protein
MQGLAQQALAIAALAAILGYFGFNIARNLEASGLTGGFGFLWQEAGFAMSFSLIPMSEEATYGRVYVAGTLNTLFIASLALVLATILGLLIGLARVAPARPMRLIAVSYIETLRNVPLLLILIFTQTVVLRSLPVVRDALNLGGGFYISNRGIYLPAPVGGPDLAIAASVAALGLCAFLVAVILRPREPIRSWGDVRTSFAGTAVGAAALLFAVTLVEWDRPVLTGFNYSGGITLMPEFVALLVALVLYNAAFIAEIVRAGIDNVDKGQIEAARALGLPLGFIHRRIVLPQALRLMVPPVTNQYIHLIKASSLATVVGFPDLVAVFLGTSLNQTGRAVEIVILTAAVYLTISLAVGAASAMYNRRVQLVER